MGWLRELLTIKGKINWAGANLKEDIESWAGIGGPVLRIGAGESVRGASDVCNGGFQRGSKRGGMNGRRWEDGGGGGEDGLTPMQADDGMS